MSDWTKDDFNSVKLIGRAGKDFETRFTQKGTAISSGSIAVGGGKKKDGTEYPTYWIDIKAFGEIGEALGECKKGDGIQITKGELQQERWNDKETGKPRSKVVVVVWEFQKIGKEDKGKSEPNYYIPAGDNNSIPF